MAKIIFVHPAIRPYLQDLFRLMDERLGVQFLFVEDREHNLQFLKGFPLRRWSVYRSFFCPFYLKGVAWALLWEVLLADYDVWIASGLHHSSTHLAFPFVKLRRKKFVLYADDWWIDKRMKTKMVLPYSRMIARHADAILATNTKSRKFFLTLGASDRKITVANNGSRNCDSFVVDPVLLSNLRQRFGLTSDSTVILYLNRIVRYKGLDILIRAFFKIEKEFPDARLLVVGDGEFRKYCESLAQSLGIRNAHFVGSIQPERVHYFYKLSDIFVLPARFCWNDAVVAEAWGFTVNEALSCGVPTIVTEAVGAADLIEDSVNGFVVEPGNEHALAGRLRALVHDRETRVRMGKNAKAMIQRFTPEAQVEIFKKVLEGLHC